MLDAMALPIATMLSLTGFALMALSQDRHWEAVTALQVDHRTSARRLRATGLTLQCLACVLLLLSEGPGFGALLWGTGMTGTATLVALMLAWRPRWLAPIGHFCRAWR